jgi:TolB-like protein
MFATPHYSFGPFVFDARGRVLYRDERDVRLPPKAAETLSVLLANAGKVIEKSALLDAAWAGLVVGESSLTRTISILRKALGNDGTDDGYIATISKRGYRFCAQVTRSSEAASPGNQVSIAVLPFNCFAAGQAQEHFSDGLTEETTAQLYKRGDGWLRVIARTSCMTYKDSPKRISEIGRELGVGYVLEGSVRGNRRRLRIAAQLIRVSDEMHVWAENYERPAGDALRLQCAVAGEIAHEVQSRLVIPEIGMY